MTLPGLEQNSTQTKHYLYPYAYSKNTLLSDFLIPCNDDGIISLRASDDR